MRRLVPSLVALMLAVFVVLGVSAPRAEAQVDFTVTYCHVYVEGYVYNTTHRSVDPVGPCEGYVQGLVDWGCPQLGDTGVFTMHLLVRQLHLKRPPSEWYLPTNWQCVGGVAERR